MKFPPENVKFTQVALCWVSMKMIMEDFDIRSLHPYYTPQTQLVPPYPFAVPL